MTVSRRSVLAGGATAFALLAGCVAEGTNGGGDSDGDDGNGSDGESDGVPVLTDFAVSEEIVVPDEERFSDMDPWAAFLASDAAAEDVFGHVEDGAGAATFIDETEFDAGETLLFVEAYGPQTCYRLALDGDPQVAENGLPTVAATVERTAPSNELCGDAVTAGHLLLRLSFDPEAPAPDVVEVTVDEANGEPEELLVEAQR